MATECHCFVNCSHGVGHSCLKSGRLASALAVPSTWAGTCFAYCDHSHVSMRQTRKIGNSGKMRRAFHDPIEVSYQRKSKNSSTVDNY